MRASGFALMMLLGWGSLAAADEPAKDAAAKDEPAKDAAAKDAAAEDAAAKDAFDADGCKAPTRLCLDRDGRPLFAPKRNLELAVGESLEVRVYSRGDLAKEKESITVTIAPRMLLSHLTETPKGLESSGRKLAATARPFQVVITATSPPVTDDQDHLLVTVIHISDTTAQPPIVVPIVGARHYVEFGAALFAVLGGNRVVTSPATTTSDVQPSGAFVVTLFAGARPDRQIGFGFWHRNAWALQLGTDFDLAQAVDQKEYYVGAAWSPLKGITLSGGLGIVRGQFLSAGLATPDLDNEAMPRFAERYMYRPYVGVTLTPQVVDSLKAALGQVQSAVRP